MPELPDAIHARLQHQYGLSDFTASSILGLYAAEDDFNAAVQYYEQAARYGDPVSVANWIVNELRPKATILSACPVFPEQIGRISQLVHSGDVTYAGGQAVLQEILQHPTTEAPEDIVSRLHLRKVTNTEHLDALCVQCIEQLPDDVLSYRSGNERVLNKLVGYTRRLSQGTADPAAVASTLRRLLAKE